MNCVVVRDMVESDLIEIFRIRTHADVARHQYPKRPDDSIDVWRRRLSGDNVVGLLTMRHSTVLTENTIAGHIIHMHYSCRGKKYVACGWDLHPNYWGRGLMYQALRLKFDIFFLEDGIDHVFSDCFPANKRCIRLLNRLGYVRQAISLHDRIVTAFAVRCARWIIRFRLDSSKWKFV